MCMCLLNQMVETLAVLQEIGMEIDDIRKSNILVEVREKRHSFKLYYDEREKLPLRAPHGYGVSYFADCFYRPSDWRKCRNTEKSRSTGRLK